MHRKIAAATKACSSAHKITPDQLEAIKKAADKSLIVASGDLKCFAKCVTEKSGIFDAAGRLDVDRLVRLSEAFGKDGATVRANAERCARQLPGAVTNCEEAWELYKCLY